MNRLLLVVFACLLSTALSAKSMKQLWASIPDSMVSYIDKNHRIEMSDYIGMGLKGDVDNMLGEKSVMDSITGDFIHLTLNESTTMQIKRLPIVDGDSIVCVVKTWNAPEGESQVTFYNQQWQKIDKKFNLQDYSSLMIVRPDTMSVANYRKVLEDIDFTMVKANLSPTNNNIVLTLSIPSETKDKAKQVKAVTKTYTIPWDGKI